MTAATLVRMEKLAKEVDKATKLVVRNRFMIETLLSWEEAKAGKRLSYSSVEELFKSLKK